MPNERLTESPDAAEAPSPAARAVWRTYFEAGQRLSHALEQRLKSECGMSLGDYNVLLLLVDAPGGSLRLGELARHMVFSPSRLTYQAGTLEKRGLIARSVCDDDRRGIVATITDEGRAAFRRAAAVHARQVDELFLTDLDESQLRTLHEVFSSLARRLDEQAG
ncbi:MarR family winged helix-turn-helix transcriptional regulator [Micrococcus cohnii]|uniref:DNA-binding MarR family transcriptional regulator n=1 Tax=Micrococcus cohnii TaxID=993416 RepID=A0A7W7GMK1_9MICC|nr:MarR family transcriptional regulator [Micrococcus cohnii]MBB4734872.1 DNA-binding MarR family transcriptional regulator [Micrococcus cohnii]